MRGSRREDSSPMGRSSRRQGPRPPRRISVKPPDQPDAVKAGQILKRHFKLMPWFQSNQMRFFRIRIRLMLYVKLQRFLVTHVANRRDGQSLVYWLAAPGNFVWIA